MELPSGVLDELHGLHLQLVKVVLLVLQITLFLQVILLGRVEFQDHLAHHHLLSFVGVVALLPD